MDSDSTLQQEIDSLVAQGWEPTGNCWTNNGPAGGRYEFRLERGDERKSLPVDKPFFWVPSVLRQPGLSL